MITPDPKAYPVRKQCRTFSMWAWRQLAIDQSHNRTRANLREQLRVGGGGRQREPSGQHWAGEEFPRMEMSSSVAMELP